MRKVLLFVLFMSPGLSSALPQSTATVVEALTLDQIMEGQDFVGTSPSQVRWSGDNQLIYFRWKQPDSADQKEASTFVIRRDGTGLRQLSEEEEETEAWPNSRTWNRERSQFLFVQNGDLFLLDRSGRRRQLTETRAAESSPQFGQTESTYIFRQGANLFRLGGSGILQVTDFRTGDAPGEEKATDSQKFLKEQQEKLFEQFSGVRKERGDRQEERRKKRDRRAHFYGKARLQQVELSPDERYVTFFQVKTSTQAETAIVPSFVTDDGFSKDLRTRTKVGDDREIGTLGIYRVEDGQVTWVEETEGAAQITGPIFSDDGSRAALHVVSSDYKKWTLSVIDLESGALSSVSELQDEAWVGGPGLGTFGWLSDNQSLYFVSEADGYAHLYTARHDGSHLRQLTSGEWEVTGLVFSHDKSRFYLTTSEMHPGERHFYSMAPSGGERTQITSMTGNNGVTLSPDESHLAILHSSSNQPPELYVQPNRPRTAVRQLTESTNASFREREWIEPQLVRIPSRDGERPWARFYKPSRPAASSPAVIFVHGAGYLQNVHKWWSSYYREYMFHHLLVPK